MPTSVELDEVLRAIAELNATAGRHGVELKVDGDGEVYSPVGSDRRLAALRGLLPSQKRLLVMVAAVAAGHFKTPIEIEGKLSPFGIGIALRTYADALCDEVIGDDALGPDFVRLIEFVPEQKRIGKRK